jgi:excisionase family DNA binding protein
MSTQAIAIIPVPSRRLFKTKDAAQYLGICEDTLRKYADLGLIKVRRLGNQRVFALEDLDAFIESLPEDNFSSYTETGGKPGGKEQANGS